MRRANVHGGAGNRAAMRERERTLCVALNPKQDDFVFSPSRFAFYVGGIGAGKTYAGAVRAILRAVQHPGSLGLIAAPTYPMLRDVTQRTVFELLPRRLIASFAKTDQHLILVNGSEILFRSADNPDRLRGLNLAWFWLDEAPLCGYTVWQILKGRLRQAGYATAGWATGTPHGRDGYARDFELEVRANHTLYRASTRENAHNLPADFIADLGYSGQFAAQEIEGHFVAFEGLVYAFDSSSSDGNLRSWAGDAFPRVVGGIDWGYTNPTAAVVFGIDGDGRAYQLDEFYQRRASRAAVSIPAIVALTQRYAVARWHADSEDPEAIAALNAAFVNAGLNTRAVAAAKGPGSVRAGIQTVTALLARRGDGTRGLYVDPRCVATIAEYGSYQYAGGDGGSTHDRDRDPSEEPRKQGDHAMDATRYALFAEVGRAARAEAYLAAMRQRLERERAAAGGGDGGGDGDFGGGGFGGGVGGRSAVEVGGVGR